MSLRRRVWFRMTAVWGRQRCVEHAAHSDLLIAQCLAQSSDDEQRYEESIGWRLCTNACACHAPELLHVRVLCSCPKMPFATTSV